MHLQAQSSANHLEIQARPHIGARQFLQQKPEHFLLCDHVGPLQLHELFPRMETALQRHGRDQEELVLSNTNRRYCDAQHRDVQAQTTGGDMLLVEYLWRQLLQPKSMGV
jgi:hypothetical protein